ncbi:Rad1-domain-containing protein [Gloeophyllum trabeum ATCC 11539]|uniref:Rad1-domain-containing protein n=1 Tax=Gloeophyllum trabeum (strain ATCC 11539 / FP-39264 / Madison 617) TaxID=670483 RepID=S7RUX3_GLOTA|nr:Rad1-domain-containing protein [Gloeophyllum trabeum ATCC 11539]EPQ58545.1 Rad1-domain-containing protein [Gloeophyllum trabeum ATCC 11539]
MSAPSQPPKPVLSASSHDVRYFAALLRGVSFSNRATIYLASNGFNVSVQEGKTITGTAFVSDHVFDEYQYNDEGFLPASQDSDSAPALGFEIRLNTLLECLNIFGTAGTASLSSNSKSKKQRRNDHDGDSDENNRHGPLDKYFTANTGGTGMRMSYAGPGHPLTLILAESSSGPTATCELTTFDPEGPVEIEFAQNTVNMHIILKSSWLRDALSELDPSCEKLTFVCTPAPQGNNASRTPLFRILAEGMFGSTEMDYPNDREVLETFICTQPVKFTYRFSHIAKSTRALQASLKTSMRTDDFGTLSMQFMMPSGRGRDDDGILFVEFRCLPLDDQV